MLAPPASSAAGALASFVSGGSSERQYSIASMRPICTLIGELRVDFGNATCCLDESKQVKERSGGI